MPRARTSLPGGADDQEEIRELGSKSQGEAQLAEFDAYANSYDSLVSDSVRISGETADYFAAYKARCIARSLTDKACNNVLDYGCGVGSLSRHLRNQLQTKRVDGYDPSPESIRKVDDDLRCQGVFTDHLSELRDDYDLIVLSNVLHHVHPEERQKLIGETRSRLLCGGLLAVIEHNPYNPLTRRAVSQCPFDEDAILLSSSETCRRLQSGGFHVLRRDFIVFFPRLLALLRCFEPFLGWCPLGAQYFILGIKTSII